MRHFTNFFAVSQPKDTLVVFEVQSEFAANIEAGVVGHVISPLLFLRFPCRWVSPLDLCLEVSSSIRLVGE